MSIRLDTDETAFYTMVDVTASAEQCLWIDAIGFVPNSVRDRNRFYRDVLKPFVSTQRRDVAIHMATWSQRQLALYETALDYERIRSKLVPTGARVTTTPNYVELSYFPREVAKSMRAEMLCQRAAECLFFQAKLLVERVAHTIAAYFAIALNGEGSAHTSLTERFKKEWARVANSRAPVDLVKLMYGLDRHIIKFRNKYVEHVAQPDSGLRTALAYTDYNESDPKMPSTTPRTYIRQRIISSGPDHVRLATPVMWEPRTVVTRIEEYLEAVLLFLNANVDVSVIGGAVPVLHAQPLLPNDGKLVRRLRIPATTAATAAAPGSLIAP